MRTRHGEMQQAPNRRVVGRGHIRERERVDAAIAQQRVLVAQQLLGERVGLLLLACDEGERGRRGGESDAIWSEAEKI